MTTCQQMLIMLLGPCLESKVKKEIWRSIIIKTRKYNEGEGKESRGKRKGKKEKKIEDYCRLKIVGKKYSKAKKRSVASNRKRVIKPLY